MASYLPEMAIKRPSLLHQGLRRPEEAKDLELRPGHKYDIRWEFFNPKQKTAHPFICRYSRASTFTRPAMASVSSSALLVVLHTRELAGSEVIVDKDCASVFI